MTFEDRLKLYANQLGIDAIGITSAEPFHEALARLERMKELGYLSPWAEPDLQTRCHPEMLMTDAASIIAVGVSYLLDDESLKHETPDEAIHQSQTGNECNECNGCTSDSVLSADSGHKHFGKLARFAQVQDYHQALRESMEKLVEFIRSAYSDVQAQIFVDTGPLIDREVAYRAGLGFIGKNSALIHPEYGSFLALGEILLNISLKPDQPMEMRCGDCTLCMQACPQQVILAPGEIQTQECLAHYTQEKGLLPETVRHKLGKRLWGCDTCQEVCPYNRKAKSGSGKLLHRHALGSEPDLEWITRMNNREYQTHIGPTAMAWRGKTTLQRNALINLGNFRNPQTIPLFTEALHDPRPIIRATAAWGLGEMGSAEAETVLKTALSQEQDDMVKAEIERSLTRLTGITQKGTELYEDKTIY